MQEQIKTTMEAQVREEHLEELVRQYRQPMRACASRVTHRFITESDEEWSVTLLAFYEAVRSYREERGSFWPFASTVIKRRLTDHLRETYRRAGTVPVDPQILAGETAVDPESADAVEREAAERMHREAERSAWPGQSTIADEIEALKEELEGFGVSFFDLTASSPKAEKTRKKCAGAAAALLSDPILSEELFGTKRLPIAALSKKSGCTKKLLEKHRRYLIAVCVILRGDYPQMAEYLRPVTEAMKA